MQRRTITIYPDIEAKLRDIQTELMKATNKNWSLSTIVNIVLLAGLIGSDGLIEEDWDMIKSFTERKSLGLEDNKIRVYVAKLASHEDMEL